MSIDMQEAGWHALGNFFPAGALSGGSYASLSSKASRGARLRFASVAWSPPKRPGTRTPRLPREACVDRRWNLCHQQIGTVEKLTPAEDHTHHPNPVVLRESARRSHHPSSASPRGLLGIFPAPGADINLLWGIRHPSSLSPRSERKQAAAVRFRCMTSTAWPGGYMILGDWRRS